MRRTPALRRPIAAALTMAAAVAVGGLQLVPAAGAASCQPFGAIGYYWSTLGGAGSWLGACTTDEMPVAGGVVEHFTGGDVYWSQPTGPHSVRGDIRATFDTLGATTSRLGLPVTDEAPTPRRFGAYNHFQGGSLYWSPATGTHLVTGAIRYEWGAEGWENSRLGVPTSNEIATTTRTGAYNTFEGGSIYWSLATGPHNVVGAIRDKWIAGGAEKSWLGFPTTNETPTPVRFGAYNHFEGGSIYWSPGTGVHSVTGAIRDRWAALGWENGALGFPTSDEYSVTGGRRSDFAGGSIVWNAATGALTVTIAAPRYGGADQVTAAFYYGWYPSSFDIPGTRYHPTAGRYNSQDLVTVQRQIDQMRYGGIRAGIASWWGQAPANASTDFAAYVTRNFAVDLQAAQGTPFEWAIYYEPEGFSNPTDARIRNDLDYIKARYAGSPNYLTFNGKPVVFVWPDASDTCVMVNRWRQLAPDFYVVQKRIPGWTGCQGAPDAWHEYAPANREIPSLGPWSYSVSPGFWQYNEANPRLGRDGAAFDGAVARMRNSRTTWQLTTTFNEWGEGTAVEPAAEWQSPSGYGWALDILHKYYGSF